MFSHWRCSVQHLRCMRPYSSTTLSLQVSSPALLLNHMAERYTSSARILMEFIDNSLDDAETLYRPEQVRYERPIVVEVTVGRKQRVITVRDNCMGMTPDVLSRVVMRVGESKKRGASFVNGQEAAVWAQLFLTFYNGSLDLECSRSGQHVRPSV